MFERIEGELKNRLEKCCEAYLWLTIEEIGGFIWRMNHDLADDRIESTPQIEEDLLTLKETISFAVLQLERLGIKGAIDEKNIPTKVYWTWYMKWKGYIDKLSTPELKELEKLAEKGTSPKLDHMRPDPRELTRADLLDLD